MLLLGLILSWRSGAIQVIRLVWAGVWLFGLLVAVAIGLWATFESMKFQDIFSPPWPNYPVPILVAFWTVTVGISLAMARWGLALTNEVYFWLAGVGMVLTWVTAIYVPGASYLFLLPTIGWGVASWWIRFDQRSAAVFAWFAVAALWFPLEPLFYDALGFSNREILLGRLMLLTLASAPICLVCWRRVDHAATSLMS